MKTFKSKLLMLTLLFMGIIAVSFALTNKEKSKVTIEKKATTTWHYKGTSTAAGEFAKVENWEQGSGSCGSTGNKPCDINVEASNESELEDYLSGMTNSEVLAINPSSRRN